MSTVRDHSGINLRVSIFPVLKGWTEKGCEAIGSKEKMCKVIYGMREEERITNGRIGKEGDAKGGEEG